MSNHPKLAHFVSEIDQYLQKFDQEHPKPSRSQQKEQEKHARIAYLRDISHRPEQLEKRGDNF